MQIGAIGGAMYTPYIYNTNTVNRASMNKIQAIGDDLPEKKTDFSALANTETTNPLKRGETLDFTGILGMQMQMGRMNAARVMKQPEQAEQITQAAGVSENEVNATANVVEQAKVAPAVEEDSNANSAANAFDFARAMQAYQPMDLYA